MYFVAVRNNVRPRFDILVLSSCPDGRTLLFRTLVPPGILCILEQRVVKINNVLRSTFLHRVVRHYTNWQFPTLVDLIMNFRASATSAANAARGLDKI